MAKEKVKLPETESGTVLFNTDPIIIQYHYDIDYIHSYAQDSPFFAGLAKRKLMGSRCNKCGTIYATPRAHCMDDGARTEWKEIPTQGKVHSFTTCYFGGQEFLDQTPYTLILVEFEGVDTLFLSRLIGAEQSELKVGMPVQAQFRRNCKFNPTDVYFVPRD